MSGDPFAMGGAARTTLTQRRRAPSFSSPFSSDAVDIDVPAVEDEERTNLLKEGGITQDSTVSKRTVVVIVAVVTVVTLTAVGAVAYAAGLFESRSAPSTSKFAAEYRVIKNPNMFHWPSRLVSLEETLQWFQDLPDLTEKTTGMHDIGSSHLKITTDPHLHDEARAAVQESFDLGLRNLHAFSPFEALRHFARCVQGDSTAPLCYWGLHMAMKWDAGYSGAAKEARETMSSLASGHDPKLSDAEQDLIEVASADDEPEACVELLDRHQALYESGQSTSQHIEIDSFCCWELVAASTNLYGHPLNPERQIAQANLKRLVAESPNHTGARHYVIHAYEDTFEPGKATESARTLEALSPGAAHFQHMPGHIYYLIGDYAEAVRAFGQSTDLDEQYFEETKVHPANNWNYIHNMAYAVASYIEAGRREEALEYGAKLLQLQVPSFEDAASKVVLQPVQFSPDTSRAGGRFFYQALLAKPFVELRNQEWDACAETFDEVLNRMRNDFNVGFLAHLPVYYSALQNFCKGMSEIYRYMDITTGLAVNTEYNPAWMRQPTVTVSEGTVAAQLINAPTGGDADVDEEREAALGRAKLCLADLVAAETALVSSTELDDNDGLAPPEVHVKNRAFFALGVHVLELQAVVKAVEGNYRRAAELLAQAASREDHILYNEPVCYPRFVMWMRRSCVDEDVMCVMNSLVPRPALQTMGELELMLYFQNGKHSGLYLDRANKTLTQAIRNPIHQRSGHILRQLVLALLLKHDHLQEHHHQLRQTLAQSALDEAQDEAKIKHQRKQEKAALRHMIETLDEAVGHIEAFQWSWRFADIKYDGWSDKLVSLLQSIQARIQFLEAK